MSLWFFYSSGGNVAPLTSYYLSGAFFHGNLILWVGFGSLSCDLVWK